MKSDNWILMTTVLLAFPAMIVGIRLLGWWNDRKEKANESKDSQSE